MCRLPATIIYLDAIAHADEKIAKPIPSMSVHVTGVIIRARMRLVMNTDSQLDVMPKLLANTQLQTRHTATMSEVEKIRSTKR